ncbi:glutathione S-transferase family protein [Photobacterium galatheae]|uniref:Glutathione S-transferase n=1 Tax=Photobacterium galatheae TaxID=1654360 RepID=A0A066RRR3_9GAMM|nr:glutathione S-transferase N-terminal domain-containing protein [Photobacterium galatheae]KDM93120.1 glutathione S-transferase [Photobacterium galatheae]MCM0148352.1 glutathione S-transferase N-terminal domain-containing protein [Photobacterium galatheae]
MDVILYSATGSNSSERVEWVLNYKAVPYKRIEVAPEGLKTSYLQINPFGYVPCLAVDGHLIQESMAIIECLEELFPPSGSQFISSQFKASQHSLIGDSVFSRAAVRAVCEYVNASIHSPQNRTVLKAFRPELSEPSKRELRGQWITTCLETLMKQLCQTSSFAIGEQFTIADIFVASIYKKALQHGAVASPFYDQHLDWLRQDEQIAAAEPFAPACVAFTNQAANSRSAPR